MNKYLMNQVRDDSKYGRITLEDYFIDNVLMDNHLKSLKKDV